MYLLDNGSTPAPPVIGSRVSWSWAHSCETISTVGAEGLTQAERPTAALGQDTRWTLTAGDVVPSRVPRLIGGVKRVWSYPTLTTFTLGTHARVHFNAHLEGPGSDFPLSCGGSAVLVTAVMLKVLQLRDHREDIGLGPWRFVSWLPMTLLVRWTKLEVTYNKIHVRVHYSENNALVSVLYQREH